MREQRTITKIKMRRTQSGNSPEVPMYVCMCVCIHVECITLPLSLSLITSLPLFDLTAAFLLFSLTCTAFCSKKYKKETLGCCPSDDSCDNDRNIHPSCLPFLPLLSSLLSFLLSLLYSYQLHQLLSEEKGYQKGFRRQDTLTSKTNVQRNNSPASSVPGP